MEWYFEPLPLHGGASVGAYRNSLAGAGINREELLAREAVQNSADAAISQDSDVKITFRSRLFEGEEMERVLETLQLSRGTEIHQRPSLLGDESLSDQLADKLPVLYVEDFNTVGLGGTIQNISSSPEDDYFRFCLQVGQTHDEAAGRGGTFGFGKSILWAISQLWTVIVYTRFNPSDRTEGAGARLIGVSWFNEHDWLGRNSDRSTRYTGRAWFCKVAETDAGPHAVPIVDDEADRVAEILGFRVREPHETGTSLMVLDPTVDLTRLRHAVEQFWWPRMLDGRLTVEIEGEPAPNPRAREDLERYVRCWDLIKEQAETTDEDKDGAIVFRSRTLGRLAVTSFSTSGSAVTDPDDPNASQLQVAMIRELGMVVKYLNAAAISSNQPESSGVFLADISMDRVFAASEPPEHDRWDYKTVRRDRQLNDRNRKDIYETHAKVRRFAREFLKSHQEAPLEVPPRCRELEKMLGRFLASRIADPPPPPPPSSDPFNIRFVEPAARVETSDGVVIDSRFRLTLRDVAFEDFDEISCRVRAWVDPLVDHGGAPPRSERIQMAYMKAHDPNDDEDIIGHDDSLSMFVEIIVPAGSSGFDFDLRSKPLPHPEYLARLQVSAEVIPQ